MQFGRSMIPRSRQCRASLQQKFMQFINRQDSDGSESHGCTSDKHVISVMHLPASKVA